MCLGAGADLHGVLGCSRKEYPTRGGWHWAKPWYASEVTACCHCPCQAVPLLRWPEGPTLVAHCAPSLASGRWAWGTNGGCSRCGSWGRPQRIKVVPQRPGSTGGSSLVGAPSSGGLAGVGSAPSSGSRLWFTGRWCRGYRAQGTWTIPSLPVGVHLRYLRGRRWSRATGTWTNLASLGGMGAFIWGVCPGTRCTPNRLDGLGNCGIGRSCPGRCLSSDSLGRGFPFGIFECPSSGLASPFTAVRGALLQYSYTSLCQKRWS